MRLTLVGKQGEKKSVQITRTGTARKEKLKNLQFGFWLSFSAVLRRIQTLLEQVKVTFLARWYLV